MGPISQPATWQPQRSHGKCGAARRPAIMSLKLITPITSHTWHIVELAGNRALHCTYIYAYLWPGYKEQQQEGVTGWDGMWIAASLQPLHMTHE